MAVCAAAAQAKVIYQDDFSGGVGVSTSTVPEIVPPGFMAHAYQTGLDGAGHLVSTNANEPSANYRFRIGAEPITGDVKYTAVLMPSAKGWIGIGFQGGNANGLLAATANSGPWVQFNQNYLVVRGGTVTSGGSRIIKDSDRGYNAGEVVTAEMTYHASSKTMDLMVNGKTIVEGYALNHEFPVGTPSDPVVSWADIQFYQTQPGEYVDSLQVSLPRMEPPYALPEFQAFVEKAQSGVPVTVAYLGGSITCGAVTWPTTGTNAAGVAYDYSAYNAEQQSWRALTFEWLRARFEKTPGQFRQVHAAIGGTPSLLGCYRLEKDVLEQKPDLVFVEFAVNDGGMGRATRDDPAAPGSILRTSRYIVDQLRKRNPQVAIFMPLSTHRVMEGSASTAWGEMLDVSLDQTRLAAEMLKVPYVSIKDAFYGGSNTGLYYDGPDTGGDYVHPAPYGYQVYAEAVEKTLADIFTDGSFVFKHTVAAVPPYPVAPRLVLPEELLGHASGWRVESPASYEAPVLKSRTCLVSGPAKKAMQYTFTGTSVGLWLDVQSKGAMDMWLDGKIVGRYANNVPSPGPFTSRFLTLSYSLDPTKLHTLRLVPVSIPAAEEPLIMLRGIVVDAGTP